MRCREEEARRSTIECSTMPKGNQRKPVTPEPIRTRSLLDLHVQTQILIDLEQQGESTTPASIASLRPTLYGELYSKVRKSVYDRIRYLRELKSADPPAYWELYASACSGTGVYLSTEEVEEVTESEISSPLASLSLRASKSPATHLIKAAFSIPTKNKQKEKKTPTMEYDPSDYDIIVNVDSADVNKNALVPGLLLFRVLNERDGNSRLHHAYQLLFLGDMELALGGSLSVSMLSPTAVEVVMPACSDVFLLHFDEFQRALKAKKKMSKAALRSHTIAANKMLNDKSFQLIKVLILFDKTGEQLTNAVFSPTGDALGTVHPKAFVVEHDFVEEGKTNAHHATTLVAGFIMARVESDERMAEIKLPRPVASLADEISDGVEGVTIGDSARPAAFQSAEYALLQEQQAFQAQQLETRASEQERQLLFEQNLAEARRQFDANRSALDQQKRDLDQQKHVLSGQEAELKMREKQHAEASGKMQQRVAELNEQATKQAMQQEGINRQLQALSAAESQHPEQMERLRLQEATLRQEQEGTNNERQGLLMKERELGQFQDTLNEKKKELDLQVANMEGRAGQLQDAVNEKKQELDLQLADIEGRRQSLLRQQDAASFGVDEVGGAGKKRKVAKEETKSAESGSSDAAAAVPDAASSLPTDPMDNAGWMKTVQQIYQERSLIVQSLDEEDGDDEDDDEDDGKEDDGKEDDDEDGDEDEDGF